MIKFDRLLFNCLFGLVIPILCFLVFWFGSVLIVQNEREIAIAAFTGLGVGLIISILIKLINKPDIYYLSKPIVILIYLFYNIGLFGFFMGVPVFHPILGIFAGYYWVKRLKYLLEKIDYKDDIKRVSGFTAVITGMVCLFSATIALISKSTPGELKHMLHLPFDISKDMLISLIVLGGLFLISAQYHLTKIAMTKILKMSNLKYHK